MTRALGDEIAEGRSRKTLVKKKRRAPILFSTLLFAF